VCNPCGKIKKEEEDEYEESGNDYRSGLKGKFKKSS